MKGYIFLIALMFVGVTMLASLYFLRQPPKVPCSTKFKVGEWVLVNQVTQGRVLEVTREDRYLVRYITFDSGDPADFKEKTFYCFELEKSN